MTSSVKLPPTIANSEVITLIPWLDQRIDASGHDPRSTYVEQFWLATLGPSTTWFLRHCVDLLDKTASTAVNLRETASTLGIGHEGGARSAMAKTVARACRFRAARSVGSATLAVRLRLPQLSHRQVNRLPESLRRRHEEFLAANSIPDIVGRQQPRARRLALGLIECGGTINEAERQMAGMRLHPAVIAEAVHWAWGRHHGQESPEADQWTPETTNDADLRQEYGLM